MYSKVTTFSNLCCIFENCYKQILKVLIMRKKIITM